ncbi:MAG TPA: metallophosphoesterase [Vicinamibacteria bacterium]|nr:metallophosphoesterase [Vicinamibacteria bacterium]
MAAADPPRLNLKDEDDAQAVPGRTAVPPSENTTSAPSPPVSAPAPPVIPPTDGKQADRKGPVKLTKKQKKLLKDSHRPLDSWERYRALTDVLDEAIDLVDLADHKARFALIIMGAINAVLFIVGTRTDVFWALPSNVRAWLSAAFVVYLVTALYFFFQAIESLRPRKSQPQVRYAGESSLEEHPLGIRFYEDILSRDVEAYRRAWREIKIGQLNAELAVQAHALAAINQAKYNALRRLYRGLHIMIFMGGGLLALAALYLFLNRGHMSLKHSGKDGTAESLPGGPADAAAAPATARDWQRYPPIAERTTSAQVVGLGDVHGAYDRLVALLLTGGLIRKTGDQPAGYAWTGGNRVLVSVGDIINKGDRAIDVIDLLRSLETQAQAAGGAVIVTLGNHEAEFMAKPGKNKSEEFRTELEKRGLDADKVADGETEYGQWLHQRPLAAKVNGWFFCHAGDSGGQTVPQLADEFRQTVDGGKWTSRFLIGNKSILEAEKWWQDRSAIDRDLAGVKAGHIVFGHDPGAFTKGRIEEKFEGRIFRIDVGMTPSVNYSKGALLFIDRQGGTDVATSLDADGTRKELWRGPAAG